MEHAQRASAQRSYASRLSLVWLGWLAVTFAVLGAWVPGLIENYDRLAHPPAEAGPALTDAMISATAHAVYHLALDLLFGLTCIAVAALVLAKNPRDHTAMAAAYVLAAWGPLNGLASESILQGPGMLQAGAVFAWAGALWLVVTSIGTYRRKPPLRIRQQLRWLWYGAATSSLLMAAVAVGVGTGATLEPAQIDRHMSGHLLLVLAGGLVPWAALTAWGRETVPDPDTLTRRTLVYGVLTTIVAGLTISLVFLPALFYYELGPVYLLMVVCTWAVLSIPLQQWVQRSVNRMMYGQREEPMAVLTALGDRLELGSPETVLSAIVETVATTLKLSGVSIRSTDGAFLARIGASELTPVVTPIVHQGERVGDLEASPRARDEPLNEHDLEILRLVARQAGPTVRAVQLNQELRRSRQEILEGREEERRRIRRDLHDGLGPALAAIAMQADTAAAIVDDDPTAARELMGAVTGQAKDIVHEVRRLVYDLRPPALDQLGLFGAIESLARQHASRNLRIDVLGATPVPALAAAAEVAVFRIVSEALTNVVRHSRATECSVRFEPDLRRLNVVVEDDGIGLSSAAATGIGLRSMSDRATEVGGTVSVALRPEGGTRVLLSMPLAGDVAQESEGRHD